jgi:hypothetical protein
MLDHIRNVTASATDCETGLLIDIFHMHYNLSCWHDTVLASRHSTKQPPFFTSSIYKNFPLQHADSTSLPITKRWTSTLIVFLNLWDLAVSWVGCRYAPQMSFCTGPREVLKRQCTVTQKHNDFPLPPKNAYSRRSSKRFVCIYRSWHPQAKYRVGNHTTLFKTHGFRIS